MRKNKTLHQTDRVTQGRPCDPVREGFTRTRKISFYDCLMSVICMHGGTLFLKYWSISAGITAAPACLLFQPTSSRGGKDKAECL